MFSEHRDMAAAKAFFRSARAVTGVTPGRVTTDGHDSYPRAIRTELGKGVRHRTSGSVRTRASQCRLKWDEANPGSCGLQDGQHGHTPPEVERSAAIGGNMLMVAGAEAEEVAQLIVSPAEPGG